MALWFVQTKKTGADGQVSGPQGRPLPGSPPSSVRCRSVHRQQAPTPPCPICWPLMPLGPDCHAGGRRTAAPSARRAPRRCGPGRPCGTARGADAGAWAAMLPNYNSAHVQQHTRYHDSKDLILLIVNRLAHLGLNYVLIKKSE